MFTSKVPKIILYFLKLGIYIAIWDDGFCTDNRLSLEIQAIK